MKKIILAAVICAMPLVGVQAAITNYQVTISSDYMQTLTILWRKRIFRFKCNI